MMKTLGRKGKKSSKKQNAAESPAPAPAAAPPAAPAPVVADTTTAAAVQQDLAAKKNKGRQSLSISGSTKQKIASNMEDVVGGSTHSHRGGPPANANNLAQVGSPPSALRELPALRDAAPNKREELFKLKLQLCGVIFSFDDPTSDKRGKDMKRQTLLELVDYVNTPAGQKIFTESVMSDLIAMVSANVCRALPPATDDFDPEEDEPVLEPAWPHLQVAYEFFLRFIVSSEVNAKAAKKYVDQRFCLQLVELFDSEDPRERDYLKTILHRIYGKFMSHRSFIRRAISNVFYRFVYETERHNGIGELLEILGSIINGFAIPLKKEHLQFLVRALIPLHKPKCVGLYHQQLSYCIIQYVEKDADTATPILNGFFKCWPWSCSGKQVLFLNELEEILELLGAEQLNQISKTLFTNLARCLDSDHFQVVERALFLWNNEHLVNSGCLSRLNAQTVLPIIYGPLYKNSSGHWNATVEGLAQNVLKMYMEYDLVLYDQCTTAYFREEEEAKKKIQAIADRWQAIEEMAETNRSQRMIAAA
jgi:serine/threonine-protein phosphatase 2A regulatory subunit B'